MGEINNEELNDIQVLAYNIGGITIREATTITFLGWVAKKMNNLEQSSPMLGELTMLVSHPPMGKMSEESKINTFRRLQALNVKL